MSTETVRYTYRLRPGRQAQAALLAEWGRCRWLWNEAVHQQKTRRKPTFGKLSKLLTEARGRNAWLREGSQVAQQQTLRTYGTALDHSFKVKGRGRPKVKRLKDALPSLEYTTRGLRIKDARLCLPGKVTIPVVWSRELPSEPTSVQVYRDSLGHWYASFVVKRDAVIPADTHDAAIGIDWGVKTTATTTDTRFDLPLYRGTRAGRKVVLVPPAYTTMTCAECGTRAKERLGLGLRIFECGNCGNIDCRDRNAARTILATAERVRASADDIRHSIASLRDGGSGAVRAENPPDLSVGNR
jgi:transposase